VQAFVQAFVQFAQTFVEILGARSGSIADAICRVRDELLNRGIGELSSAILGGDIQR